MFVYRRLASPLHATRATIGALWALALIAAALLTDHPLVLFALALALVGASLAAGVGAQLTRVPRVAIVMAVPIVAVNVLVSREGLTVFARLGDLGPFGQGNLTVEALAYGGVIALKVTLLPLIAGLAALTVDPDELLGVLRRLSFRSALTASLATRMMGVLIADANRMAEAQRTRPPGAPGAGRARVALISAVVGSSLDRAMDVACTLELRGFAGPDRAPRRHRPLSRHDLAFAASAVVLLATVLLAHATGAVSFSAYPLLRWTVGYPTLAACVAVVLVVLLPFCDRRGIEP
ncbi:MAG: energy-coupling factor transporter transmembrane component T [Solirubrobacteraceae bacterium]